MADFDDQQNENTATGLGGEQRGPDFSRGDLNAREENPDTALQDAANENPFQYPGEKSEPSSQSGQQGLSSKIGGLARSNLGKMGLAAGGIGGIVIVISAFFTLSIAPLAFLENIMPDLDTSVGGLTGAHTALVMSKLSSTDATKGCSTLSIRCKFGTMSEAQKARYERAGFKIEGEERSIAGTKRTKVTSITFQDTAYKSAEDFTAARKSNTAMRTADLRANNMRYLSTKTAKFKNAVLTRFGVTKQKPSLKGTKAERLNQLLTAAGTADPKNLSFSKVTDKNGKEGYTLNGDTSGTVYTETQMNDMIKLAASASKSSPLSALKATTSTAEFQTLAKGASIIGAADAACSIYNTVGAVAVAAKITTIDKLIKFAQPVFALIQSVKAGDETSASESLAALGELVTTVDTRKTINVGGETVDNPNHNSSVMTSPLVAMSGDGVVYGVTDETLQFTSGLSVDKLLGAAGGLFTGFSQASLKATCGVVQNWFVRGAGVIVGIIAAFGSGGTSLALQGVAILGMMGAMYAVNAALQNAIQGPNLEEAFASGSTEALGSALWLGFAGEMGAHAASAGLVPGNTSEIMSYQSLVLDEVNNDYALMEKEDAKNNPFDVNNEYSFLGSAARQYGKVTNYGSSPVSIMAGVVALATGRTLTTATTANALANLSSERFDQCADQSYVALGVNADVGCNLRYVMLAADTAKLALDDAGSKIAAWMEDNGYVDPDTTTGLPIGYTAPNMAQAQNAAVQLVLGAASGFVGQFYDARGPQYGTGVAAEYGKYIDFCANRTMPYGEQFVESSAINALDNGWITGSKCREDSEELSYFRSYTALLAAQASEDEEKPPATAATGSGLLATGASGECAANTKKLGVYDQAHDNGQQVSVVLCELSSIQLVSGFYTELDPAIFSSGSGGIIVGASVSDAFEKLGEAAKAGGRQLVGKGIRSYEKQQYFYGCYLEKLAGEPNPCNGGNLAAKPGNSNHENGTAVDFVLGSGDLEWLRANGGTYGLKELTGGSQPEPWHWSPTGQ